MRIDESSKSRLKPKGELLFFLSRILNWSFRTVLNRFILIFLVYSLIYSILVPFSTSLLVIILIVSLLFSLNYIRVSQNFNLNRMTGCLNMSLDNPADYRKYSYRYERQNISKKFKQGFIDAIINASKYKKTLNFSTHKWAIDEVVYSGEIQSIFEIEVTKNKKSAKIIMEVLILFSKEEFERYPRYACQIAERERDSFSVKLKRKKPF